MLRSLTLLGLVLTTTLMGATLEEDFRAPPTIVKPYVWWHWMGANFSKEGITKDLEAMKAAGIGGATIFNLTSGVCESQSPIGNLPWPDHTYRSPAYWECLRHAALEAKRLGLEIGLHNTVGYSTTGGPWVSEEQAMMQVLWSESAATGGATVTQDLSQPKPNQRPGWGRAHQDPVKFYRDISVLAIPAGESPIAPERIIDLSRFTDAKGHLIWPDAPAGKWTIVRLGYGPTGSVPHPVPDDVLGKVREANKMDANVTRFHWSTVLDPIKEHLGPLVGDSFKHVLIDSYEAGHQNWTTDFRATFTKRFGYDPVPWLATGNAMLGGKKDSTRIIGDADQSARFEYDLRTMVAELYQTNSWETGAKLIHDAGLTLQHEAYGGPFDTVAGSYLADLPMGEFWSNSSGGIGGSIVPGARAGGHRVVGAEAFTGLPQLSQFSETPEMLLKGTLGTYAGGVNRLVLHHWVHQPFGDQFVPGQGMGWWGTHFGRNQTWFEGGKAWLAFASRCQALLQHGETWVSTLAVGKPVGSSDAIPMAVFLIDLKVDRGDVVLPSGRRYPVLIVPHGGALEPEALHKIRDLLRDGATIVATAPIRSPSLANYPACDAEVKTLAAELWAPKAQPHLFTDLRLALESRHVQPDVTVVRGGTNGLRTLHRTASDADIVYVTNLDDKAVSCTLSLIGNQRLPEIWNPENGSMANAPAWRVSDDRTEVDLTLPAMTARFVVLRAPIAVRPTVNAITITAGTAEVVGTKDGPVLRAETATTATVTRGSLSTELNAVPVAEPVTVAGPWSVAFSGLGTGGSTISLATLGSWTDHSDPLIRYASGTGTYTTMIQIPDAWLANRGRVMLDLGTVHDLANVTCNGVNLGIAWRAPFRVDLTAAAKPGTNTVVVAVTNTWHNRLVGDEQEPEDCEWGKPRTFGKQVVGRPLASFPEWFTAGKPRPSTGRKCFVTWNYMTKDTPLLPAGLIGPVRLVPVAEVAITP